MLNSLHGFAVHPWWWENRRGPEDPESAQLYAICQSDTFAKERALISAIESLPIYYLRVHHGLSSLTAWCAVTACLQTAYTRSLRHRRRPWLQLEARRWS